MNSYQICIHVKFENIRIDTVFCQFYVNGINKKETVHYIIVVILSGKVLLDQLLKKISLSLYISFITQLSFLRFEVSP